MKYSCHICGEINHKIIDCPKYNDMQNMFKNKRVKTIKKSYVVESKVANPSVQIVDVSMAITGTRLLMNKCSRIKNQSRKNLLLTGKRSRDYNNILSRQYKRCKQKTHHKVWIKRRKHNGVQVGQDYQRLRCPQNQLYQKICLLFQTTKLCIWGRCKLQWFTFVTRQCFFPWVPLFQMHMMINICLDLLIGTWS